MGFLILNQIIPTKTFLPYKKGFVWYFRITALKSVVIMCRSYGTHFVILYRFHRVEIRCQYVSFLRNLFSHSESDINSSSTHIIKTNICIILNILFIPGLLLVQSSKCRSSNFFSVSSVIPVANKKSLKSKESCSSQTYYRLKSAKSAKSA